MKGHVSQWPGPFSHILAVSCCLLLLLLTTGCISIPPMDPQPAHMDLAQFKTASVEVKSDVPEPFDDQFRYELRLANQIITALRKDQIFDKVYPASDAPTDLQIIITITHIRDVNLLQRGLVGVLAGQARAEARVEFRENATGKLLGSYLFDNDSRFNTDVSSLTADAIDRLAYRILELIHHNL